MRKFQSGDYNTKGKFNGIKYYMRRIFRIWPLYFLSIPIFAVAYSVRVVWEQYFFIQNLLPSTFSWIPLWTLVIEELFYLILPLWAIAFKKNWLVSLICMAGLNIGYILFLIFGLHAHVLTTYMFAQFPMFAMCYALGTVIAMDKKVKMNALLIIILWIYASVILYKLEISIYAPIAFAIIYFLFLSNFRKSRFFTNKAAHFLGTLTYPIYILSVPVEFAAIYIFGRSNLLAWIPVTVICTVCLAYFVHRYFEKPFINFGYGIEKLIFGSQ